MVVKNKNEIKVSVIMPIYNGEKILDEYLPQVLNQSLKAVNFFLVNDGSKDKTLEILKKYEAKDSRITVLTQENGGAGSARNLGLNYLKEHPELRGKYLWFPDLGDDFDSDFLSKMWTVAQINQSDLVRCAYFIKVNPKLGYRPVNLSGYALLPFNLLSSFDSTNAKEYSKFVTTTPWEKIYLTEIVFKNNLYFDTSPIFNDVTFNVLFYCIAQKISYLDEKLIYYNTSTNQITKNIQGYDFEKKNNFLASLNKYFLSDAQLEIDSIKSNYSKYFKSGFEVWDSCIKQMKRLGIWPKSKELIQIRFIISSCYLFNFIAPDLKSEFMKLFDFYCQKFDITEELIISNSAFKKTHLRFFELTKDYRQQFSSNK